MSLKDNYLAKVQESWKLVGTRTPTDNLELKQEYYQKIFNIFQVGKSYFFIFLPSLNKIEKMSPSFFNLTGYDPETITMEFLFDHIHPDDVATFVDFESEVVNFKLKLPKDKLMKYKTQYNYRLRTKNGNYIKVLQQSITIQCDEDGTIIRNLVVHTDISNFKTDNLMRLSFIGLEGEPSFTNVKLPLKNTAKNYGLTSREMEILLLLINDNDTKNIANLLYISEHTVKTHRKNIHSKLGTNNPLQLILKAMDLGLI